MRKPFDLALLALLLISAPSCSASDLPSSVWFGTAPFCCASQQDCDILGLNYVRSDPSGDGIPCLCGEKVLCEAPNIPLRPTAIDRVTRLTVVQYNILDRPFWVGHDGQRERLCRIPQALARHIASYEHVDVIVVNEGFARTCAPGLNLTDLLAYYGWRHHLPPISVWWKPSNGGIFIASKWPIIVSENKVYRACSASDCLAAKGVQYAKVAKTVDGRTKFFHLFGTHMQGYGSGQVVEARQQQALELASFIEGKAIPDDEPVLISGDFNVRGPESALFQELVRTLRASMPPLVGDRRGSMDVDNTLIGRGPWLVDFVLPSTAHQLPTHATLEIAGLKADAPFDICMAAPLQPFYVGPYARTCTQTLRIRDLSDHYPVIGRFEYKE
jgi:endonuclease/exonuclease/phosphatase family metal-dependent hydrolase